MKQQIQILLISLLASTTMQAQTPLTVGMNSYRDGDVIAVFPTKYILKDDHSEAIKHVPVILVENMSKATSSTVISSSHPVPACYRYDGGYGLNYHHKSPLLPDYSDNEYMYSCNGSAASIIKDVRIDAKSGIHWKDDYKYFYPR